MSAEAERGRNRFRLMRPSRSAGAAPPASLLGYSLLIALLLLPIQVSVTQSTSPPSPPVGRCPSRCDCQRDAGVETVVTCHRSDHVHIPPIPETTLVLDLDHNHISLLQNGSLHRARQLQVLSLQDNGILHLDAGVFDSQRDLQVLRLGRNHLSSLPANIFSNNRRLRVLDIHANYFASVPENIMYSLHSLQLLNISFNHLSSAQLGPGFRYTSQLSVIDLSGNDLTSLESSSFEVMQSWDDQVPRHINLSYCNLRRIHPAAFHHIPRPVSLNLEGNLRVPQTELQLALRNMDLSAIERMDLSHMNITDLAEFVHDFQPSGLLRLELSHNRLRTIPKGTFFFFVNLQHLDLRHNEISVIENLGLSKLEYLYLAHNNINKLDEMMFEGLHELKVLDVSHNSITRVDDEPFLNLFNLHTIDASNNQIYQFHINDGLESLETLLAGWNRVSNLRFLQRLRRLSAVDVSHNVITRLGEELFARGQKIRYANFSSNAISEVSPNAFRYGDYGVIDLAHNRLTTLSHLGWESVRVIHLENNILHNITANSLRTLNVLRELHLQNNRLHSFPKQLFTDLLNLTHLDLSFNPIGPYLELSETARTFVRLESLAVLYLRKTGLAQIPSDLLQNLTNLKDLDLSHNRLARLSRDTLPLLLRLERLDVSYNSLAQVPVDILQITEKSRVLDISANPFECTCELVPLCQRIFARNQRLTVLSTENRTLYQCALPDEWSGVALAEFLDGSRQCSYFEKAVIGAIVGSTVLVLIVIVIVTVCRYRAWRRQRHKKKKPARPSMTYKFVDETSLTSSSNSSSNNGAGAGAPAVAPTTAALLSKQWV